MIKYVIEVCTDVGASTTEKGALLESLTSSFLLTQGFEVSGDVRVTGMEIDVLARDKTTGEVVLVECKAYRSNIAAEVITKLLGNVLLRNVASGWLVTTHDFGKDAKGIYDEWGNNPPERKRMLRMYPPGRLIERLRDAGIICDVMSMHVDPGEYRLGGEAYLLVTRRGHFWARPLVDQSSGATAAVAVYSANDGKRIADQPMLTWLSQLDSSLNALDWISHKSKGPTLSALKEEFDHIVSVPVAEHWADYRPSRPSDYVGRITIQRDIFAFLDRVREGATRTRMLALKGPSGWGKSSSILKIADRASNKHNKAKYFVYTVDSRAALTRRFPELAIVAAVRDVIKSGFVPGVDSVEFGNGANVLSTDGTAKFRDQLREQQKVVVVFFDQFEELLYKEELADVFDEMRGVCAAIEATQAQVVIAFSWKTDGTITTEHGAYHLWHSHADRRFEIDLPPFSDKEVSIALNKFSEELGERLAPPLRRLLHDHCQGFPWLLKKLCIHILDLIRGGADQSDVLSGNLNIANLFRRDLDGLSEAEVSCIRQVAQEAPAEVFKILQDFHEDTVTSLIHKRLVIRSGTRISLYWDIFREYILSGRIPYIPITYMPQSNFSLFRRAAKFLAGNSACTYAQIEAGLGLSPGATDNLVRDLVNIGCVEANRKDSTVTPVVVSEEEAFKVSLRFWANHEIYRLLMSDVGIGRHFSPKHLSDVYGQLISRSSFSENTIGVYSSRTLDWLINVGVIDQNGEDLVLQDASTISMSGFDDARIRQRSKGIFLGNTSPRNVVAALAELIAAPIPSKEADGRLGRNAIAALSALKLLRLSGGFIVPASAYASAEETVRTAALQSPGLQIAIAALAKDPEATGLLIGQLVGDQFGAEWSQASKLRYGTALATWARWATNSTPKRAGRIQAKSTIIP